MLFSSSSTIQCKRKRIREDGRYMHRENAYARIAMNERKNMRRQLLFLVKYLRRI